MRNPEPVKKKETSSELFEKPSPGEGFDPFKAEDKLVEETTTTKPVVEQGE